MPSDADSPGDGTARVEDGGIVTLRDVIRELHDKAGTFARRFTRPVYGVDARSLPDHIGTCLLLEVDGAKYVVTAAHVVDHNENTTLYVLGETEPVIMVGPCRLSTPPGGIREKDKIDIAVIRLTPETVDQIGSAEYLTPDKFDCGGFVPSNLCMALGYPNSRQKQRNPDQPGLRPKPVSIANLSVPAASKASIGVSDATHVLVKYDRNNAIHENDIVDTGPDPRGMSGGGIWSVVNLRDTEAVANGTADPKLVGILIEFRSAQQVFLATRISIVVETIRRFDEKP